MSMWSLSSVSSVFIRLRSCCACIAACVFFSIIRFFSSSRCRISSTCTHVTTHTRSSYERVQGWEPLGTGTIQSALHGQRSARDVKTLPIVQRADWRGNRRREALHDPVSCSPVLPYPYNDLPVTSISPVPTSPYIGTPSTIPPYIRHCCIY